MNPSSRNGIWTLVAALFVSVPTGYMVAEYGCRKDTAVQLTCAQR